MRRLYYLAEDIDTTSAISERLHSEGISDWNFHVLAKDPSGLYTRHIHSTLPHHDKDLIRTGEIGALYGGFGIGLLALIIFLLASASWMSGWFDVVLFTVLGALSGGLVGIRVGMKRKNHRLESFYADIEGGKFLIMVDVRKEDRAKIRELMNMEYPQVEYRGNESTFIRPFKANKRVLPGATTS